MYIWNTSALADSLKSGHVKQKEYMKYYIYTGVLTLIGFYLSMLEPRETSYAIWFEAIGTIVITVIGLHIIFIENGGDEGTDFLNRVVSLSFPLLIKVVVAGFILAILLEILREFGLPAEQIEWLYSASIVFIQAIFFLRIRTHIKYINA